LAVGLKVDVEALPKSLQKSLGHGEVDLNAPATTLALLQLNEVSRGQLARALTSVASLNRNDWQELRTLHPSGLSTGACRLEPKAKYQNPSRGKINQVAQLNGSHCHRVSRAATRLAVWL
jgi:hypothetical protein